MLKIPANSGIISGASSDKKPQEKDEVKRVSSKKWKLHSEDSVQRLTSF